MSARLDHCPRDRRGLIWAYQLDPVRPRTIDDASDPDDRPSWYHFNLVDARARTWLAEQTDLPEAARSALLAADPQPRIICLSEGIVGIVEDLQHDFRGDPNHFGSLRFFVSERRVFTARRRPLATVDDLHRGMERGDALPSTAAWLSALMAGLARNYAEATRQVVASAEQLEEEVAAGRGTPAQRAALTAQRRLLIRLRRNAQANRLALRHVRGEPVERRAFEPVSRREGALLDDVLEELELAHERVRMLQDELAALLAEASNRNLYLLSVVTSALLPASLVTGVWGMNVGGLPWHHDAYGALWAALSLLGSVVVALVVLRRARVL